MFLILIMMMTWGLENIKALKTNMYFREYGGLGSTHPGVMFWDMENNERCKRQQSGSESIGPEALKVATKQAELQRLLQQVYQAQAVVKMESGEVSRTQQVAEEAEQALEEAANKVRMLSGALQNAQEAAAAAAVRAHTAHRQLAIHDQLMFNARQTVDAISSQMVAVQADLTAAQEAFTLNNSTKLLEQQGRFHDGGTSILHQQVAAHIPNNLLSTQNRLYPAGKQSQPLMYPYAFE